MAVANPILDSFTKYLKDGFALRQDWEAKPVLGQNFKYETVKAAVVHLKKMDPALHRLLAYRWQCARTRNAIADSLYLDPSTLKRSWDRGMKLIINRLTNPEVMEDLDPVDLVQYD